VNGRLKKAYVGTGAAAEMAAMLDATERERRFAARLKALEERTCLTRAELTLNQAGKLVNLLAEAVFVLGGGYVHHGDWRRRRCDATNSE
jgi:hypothetical protein